MANCDPYNPPVLFDDGCVTFKTGSLDKMFLTLPRVVDQLPNPITLLALNTRIDNEDEDGAPDTAAPIREFTIIGSTDARETTQQALPLGDVAYARGNKTFAFEIKDLTAENVAWAIGVSDLGSVKYKAWFQGADLFIGGYQGMNGTLTVDVVYASDRTTLVSINGTFITRQSLNAATTTLLPVYD